MGKSHKKVKSDRINTLRKQYDAFLEEDKRRKDRNEYILRWLDRVRTCPTAPSIGIQENSFETYQNRMRKKCEAVVRHIPNIKPPFVESIDETVLKELSKKFILIPKKSESEQDCNFVCNVQHMTGVNNDSDWKSKYNILDELKQNEKEEHCFIKNNDLKKFSSKEVVPIKYQNNSEINLSGDLNIEAKDKLSNKSEKFANIATKAPKQFEHCFQNKKIDNNNDVISDIKTTACVSNLGTTNDKPDNIISQHISENNVQELKSSVPINGIKIDLQSGVKDNKKNELTTNSQQNLLEINEAKSNYTILPQSNTVPNKNEVNENMCEKREDTNNTAQSNALSKESDVPVVREYETIPHEQKVDPQIHINAPNEIVNIEEISSGLKTPTMHKVNSEFQPETEPRLNDRNTESDQTQIDEFETEQKELFYSEDTNENYAYNEENIANNENYGNNEQYSYYETTKDDQNNYRAEINEHEESTERYDPHYEQQYVNSYEGNTLENEYPNEEFIQDPNSEYQQQQYYENYENQQLQNNVVPEQLNQTLFEDTAYISSDVVQQPNTENSYNQDYNLEQITTSQNDMIEQNLGQQLDIEDGYTAEQTAVETEYLEIERSDMAQEEMQHDNLKST